MFLLKQILPSAILAFAVAAAISAIALFCQNQRMRNALFASAGAAGYAAGHFLIAGLTTLPPVDTTNWLPYFALTAAIALAATQFLRRASMRLLFFGVISAGALRLLLTPNFRNPAFVATGWLWVIALGIATVLLALVLAEVARAVSSPIELPLHFLVVAAATAGSLVLGGSLLLGQFAAVLAASSLPTHFAKRGEAPVPVSALLLVSLLACGYFFAELPMISGILLALAPALALIPRMSPSYTGVAVRFFLVSACSAVALFLAFRSSPRLDY